MFEGGVRGTAVIYSKLFEKNGIINRDLLHITDLLPTFYAAAGDVKFMFGKTKNTFRVFFLGGDVANLGEIDGFNQWDIFTTTNTTSKRNEILLDIDELENQSGFLAQNGRYKLINGKYYFRNKQPK